MVIEEELDFNSTLKAEMDSITKSLSKISQLVNGKLTKKHKVKESTVDTIGKNIELWNGVITGLGQKTDVNINDL